MRLGVESADATVLPALRATASSTGRAVETVVSTAWAAVSVVGAAISAAPCAIVNA
jgi:hypothetical protein